MFSTYELSRFLGRKIALYQFESTNSSWLFTNADRNIVVGAQTFVSVRGIQHTTTQQSSQSVQANQVKISMPFPLNPSATNLPPTMDLGAQFRPYPPSQRIFATVFTMHYGDPDQQLNVEWVGRVLSPAFTDTTMTLTCDPSWRNSRTGGRMPRIGRSCDVPVYSQGLGMCNLVAASFAVAATLTAVDGVTLTAAAFGTAPLPLAGGFFVWTKADGSTDRRTINGQSGTTITLNYGALDLAVGLVGTAYPGCTHDAAGCASFSNSANFPGYVNLPAQDPMIMSQYVG